jgi:hypothetical protein
MARSRGPEGINGGHVESPPEYLLEDEAAPDRSVSDFSCVLVPAGALIAAAASRAPGPSGASGERERVEYMTAGSTRPLAAASVTLALTLVVGCGGSGDTTTIINQTTTKTVPSDDATGTTGAQGGAGGATTTPADPSPSSESSGPCGKKGEVYAGPGEPWQENPSTPGYYDVEVLSGGCSYAEDVAAEFVRRYGPNCFDGCRMTIQNIPCETKGVDDVVCAAARTEVRFSIVGAS